MANAQYSYTISGGAATITGYTGAGGNVVIPATINGYRVVGIGSSSFYGKWNVTSVTIPNQVVFIGNYAFGNCNSLTSVAIPNSVTSIGSYAFEYCLSLTSVAIPNSVTSIGNNAFFDCYSLTSMTIPSSVTSIGNNAFAYCGDLTSVICLGKAPALGGNAVFSNVAAEAKVYYYYGTSGWNSSYGGLPTKMLGAPAPQIGGNVRVQAGQFGFTLTGVANQTIIVEASTNLLNWQPVWTNTLSGTSTNFTDAQWSNYPCQYYRAR